MDAGEGRLIKPKLVLSAQACDPKMGCNEQLCSPMIHGQ
jgi:hypothetical protein